MVNSSLILHHSGLVMAEKKMQLEHGDDDSLTDIRRRISESEEANLTTDTHTQGVWERLKLAPHKNLPYTLNYIELMFTDFVELHGDRRFGDDHAMVTGFAKFQGEPCVIIGHQKGRTTKLRQYRNF